MNPPPRPGESDAMYRARVDELRLKAENLIVADNWSHKREGTAQTHEHASKASEGSLARLYMKGHINGDQLDCAHQIASVAEMIARDVAVKTVEWKMAVDTSGQHGAALVEGVLRVRMEVAYGWWRQRLPQPHQAILDMIIGDAKPPSAIAQQYRMGSQRARYLLVRAPDLWPEAMDFAEATVDREDIRAAHARLG